MSVALLVSYCDQDADEKGQVVREPEKRTELEIAEDQLKDLVDLSVRPESQAARECRNFINIVMSTFAPGGLAVVMKALLTFQEMQRVSAKDLAEKMGLDRKQMREYLSRLKALGYVVETTGMTEWTQKTQRYSNGDNNRYRGNGREALYHIDFKYFIMMTHFRLHKILKRLDVKEGDEDDTGYVCTKKNCYLCFKIIKIMDLISKYPSKMKDGFRCSECHEPLRDAYKFRNYQNVKLTKKMKFNRQIRSLRTLLSSIQDKVNREGDAMDTQIRKLENKIERIRENGGFEGYQAATLRRSAGQHTAHIGRGGGGKTGLAHLDRIGRRVSVFKNFVCRIEEDQNEKVEETQVVQDKNKEENDEIGRKREAAGFEKRVRTFMKEILPYELGVKGKEEMPETDVDLSVFNAVTVMAGDRQLSMVEVLKNPKYEDMMTGEQWLRYHALLEQAGLLEIE